MATQSNLLGPTPKSAITVGYIDPVLGFIDNVSINDANKYAQANPGTIFIFVDGDNTLKFLNINEVNALTPNDIKTKNTNCDTTPKKCGPPIINFFGGGGIGASANPIIGQDGSLLAVDVVSGGFGYRFPPKVTAEDNCQFGSGAVLTSRLGETSITLESYEDEDDFEDYMIEDEDDGSIVEWGPDGEVIGKWNSSDYDFDGGSLNLTDPLKDEIEKYQDVLSRFPFWSTRENKPSKITSLDESYSIPHDVTHPSWNEFMNKYAISPVPPSDVSGTDFSGRIFTFEWIEEFPYAGQYTFRGLCDNAAKVYLDDDVIYENLNIYNGAVSSFTSNVTEGFHVIRVDLLNTPSLQTTITGVDVNFRVFGEGRNTHKMSFSFIAEDGSHNFTIKGVSKPGTSRQDTIKIKPGVKYRVVATSTVGAGTVEQGILSNNLKNTEGGLLESTSIFADNLTSENDNNDIKLILDKGIFVASNKREYGGRSTFDLSYSLSVESLEGNIITENSPSPIVSYSIPTVKFIKNKDQYYVQVSGEGSVTAKMKMQVDDDPNIAGVAASEIRLPTDSGYVLFKRKVSSGSYLENETITKNVSFTGGKLYGPIEIIGSSSGETLFGSKKLDLLDSDGQDANISFEIFSVEPIRNQSAINVTSIVSSASWNQNPIGLSMIIEAPLPPVPRETIPKQEGRCPPNPIWSTRFSNAQQEWYPVRNDIWTDFFNRYAVSPIRPSIDPGSDGSGIVYKNSWPVEIPYDGYYQFQVQRDNTARIYVDGILSFDVKTSGDVQWIQSGLVNKVKSEKLFLNKGSHTISIELENSVQNTSSAVEQKIFSTQDWRTPGSFSTDTTSEIKAKFIQLGSGFYLQVDGTGSAEISFTMEVNDSPIIAGLAANEVAIPSEDGRVRFTRTKGLPSVNAKNQTIGQSTFVEGSYVTQETIKKSGTFVGGKKYGPIDIIGADLAAKGPIINNSQRLGIRDAEGEDENIKINITKIEPAQITPSGTPIEVAQGQVKNGVTYEGPVIFAHNDSDWSDFMNNYSVSPKVFVSISEPEDPVIGKYTLTWKNVNFPQDGTYKINIQCDNEGVLKIGNQEIVKVSDFSGKPIQYYANVTAGNYDVSVELENFERPEDNRQSFIFLNNPMAVALYITKDITYSTTSSSTWFTNPVGVSAVLISPPCPKEVGGKGVVSEVLVNDPGNGYLPPNEPGGTYPVTLELIGVQVENPGINYSCGRDEIKIVPDNGAVLSYTCDSFGRISTVNVDTPGYGFTSYPTITIEPPPGELPTGVNASFRPIFRVVRDPVALQVPPEKLIQVTDLVGVKQTGYVDGRAYYGAVYYENGIRYAGYYKTVGTPIQVYDTLQESITAKVTTPASAVQVSGTDISSNDPLLNIPGTIRTTTELE